ncbi:MAG TPA: YihY/virulence factor BrkB family protein [Ignavibacteria bacterium]|nr:YihY/virulence factor BrkB family protein [Ignavibacteria bacterium]HMR41123.1 YihY/virulence factor BrkB family protein [Ignavibacteria bacterium]
MEDHKSESENDRLTLKVIRGLFKQTFIQFIDDKGLKMAAALSYYAAFSLGPFLIIVISIAGFIFGEEAAKGEISNQITYFIGKDSAGIVQSIIAGAANFSTGIFAGMVSLILLFVGSVAVFIELQESLNIIWGVEEKPGRGIWGFLKNRLISFSMVIVTGFLLMFLLVVNSVISLLHNLLSENLQGFLPLSEIINLISSFIIVTILFALIFKYLPDVLISWRYVWFGAVFTSSLFTAGKYLIALYLGNTSYTSIYGAAASIVVILVWIYYSGIILYFGAEFTQVYRTRFSKTDLRPDVDGVIVPKISELIKESMKESKESDENL